LEKNPLLKPEDYIIPDFLDPSKRMEGEECDDLHSVMIKLGVLMNKYRVIPKSYFKDAVKKLLLFIKYLLNYCFYLFLIYYLFIILLG
jgi:hypothetical protein